PTPHERILLARFREVEWRYLENRMNEMALACEQFDEARLREILLDLVPESSFSSAVPAVTADVIPLHPAARTRGVS
ncbi:MAG: hypothetical protein KDI42_10680, partial [Gammaproteobacteria bacterium]|nr:hypothetical protein [Gammaproteobacteria bacterium]